MKIEGEPVMFFETGMEGNMWAVEPPNAKSPADIGFLEEGDHFTIWNEVGEVVFDGTIDPDRKAAMTQNPINPHHRQPAVFGRWVHWIQRGWYPETWASMFITRESRLAVLIKSEDNAQKLREIELALARNRGVSPKLIDGTPDEEDDPGSDDLVEYTPRGRK